MLTALSAPPIVLGDHAAPVKLVAISGDGKYLASADTERLVTLWHAGKELFSKNLRAWHERFLALDRVRAITFSPDSSRLYVASGETVKAYRIPGGEMLWERGRRPTFAFLITCPQSLSIALDGRIAVAYDDGNIEVYDSGGSLLSCWSDNDAPKSLAFLRDGHTIVGTDFVSICTWDTGSGAKISKHVPDHKIYALAESPVSDLIATRSLYEIEIWSTSSGDRVAFLPARPGLPALSFNPVDRDLVVGDATGFSLIDPASIEINRTETAFAPLSFAFAPDASTLAIGCSDGSIRGYRLR